MFIRIKSIMFKINGKEDYFQQIPKVLKIEIFKYLPLSELINVSHVNKYLCALIRGHNWDHLIVRLKDTDKIQSVVKNFNFLKYDFSESNITDDIVKKLSGCHSLNLSFCPQITDESVKELRGCHTLNLRYCRQLTDESVKELRGCHTLYLSFCDQITDGSVKELRGCHILNLSYCDKITDESVKELHGCHTLYLHCCKKITKSLVESLTESGVYIRY